MFLIVPKYNGSCKRRVDTNRSDTPISKNVSNTMSILNNVIGSLERIFRYLTELCRMHFRMASGENHLPASLIGPFSKIIAVPVK
jgi:hypothetical protein